MNLQQLEYLVAVDQYRHFARAAEACFVTQPTLSMMIQKIEEELGVKVFDRSRQPVCPTDIGQNIILQARKILLEVSQLKEIVNEAENTLKGELRIGVIPTIAPYLLPLFIQKFYEEYPTVHLKIAEMITENVLAKLESGDLDVGILVTPENDKTLKEMPLYTEAFVVYTARKFDKEYLLAEDIDVNDLLLLEEGHCFRTQIVKFCELRKPIDLRVEYTSGSLETLRNLADKNAGITILPDMATYDFSVEQRLKLKRFAEPAPVRKVSLVMKRDFVKKRLVEALFKVIKENLPKEIQSENGRIVPFSLVK